MGFYGPEGARFSSMDWDEDFNLEDFVANAKLVLLVDEEEGGIVGLILEHREKEYVDRLNRLSLTERWGTPSEALAKEIDAVMEQLDDPNIDMRSPSGHAVMVTGLDADRDEVYIIIDQYGDEEPRVRAYPGTMSAHQAWDELVFDEREQAE